MSVLTSTEREEEAPCGPTSRSIGPVTDLTKWRLYSVRGRQTWVYEESEEEDGRRDQNFIEKHSLGLDTVSA